MTLLRLTLSDLLADRRRTILTILAIAPLVAASLILLAVADGLRGVGEAGRGRCEVQGDRRRMGGALERRDAQSLR